MDFVRAWHDGILYMVLKTVAAAWVPDETDEVVGEEH
jgi:hypothetical protein